MKKSITIGICVILILFIVADVFGYININNILNVGKTDKEAKIIKDEQPDIKENSTFASISKKSTEEAIADVQTKVSFRVLKPTYIPGGYILNTTMISGIRFEGFSSEMEQAMLPYEKGKDNLVLLELHIIKDDTNIIINTSKTPWEYIDINGAMGRFLEESDGAKQLSWETNNLNLTIMSSTQNSSDVNSLSKEEMIKMAKSIK